MDYKCTIQGNAELIALILEADAQGADFVKTFELEPLVKAILMQQLPYGEDSEAAFNVVSEKLSHM